MTAPILFTLIKRLLNDTLLALSGTLSVVLSFLVWSAGIRAEVYAPQLLTLALSGWSLVRVAHALTTRNALIAGAAYGIALAMHPGSILFAPGLLIVFLKLRLNWSQRIAAGALAVVLFALPLLYFPLRYMANPALNLAGQYAADGSFQPVHLVTLQGIFWVLRGQQFSSLFFATGLLPSPDELLKFGFQFWRNFIGVGILLGLGGVITMPRNMRWAWMIFFLPTAYFFASYAAIDSETMYGPALMMWGIAIAYGLRAVLQRVESGLRLPLTAALPLILLIVNFPLLNLRTDNHVRERAQLILDALPADDTVIGSWFEILPLQYLQIVEGERPDLHLYNQFLFDDHTLVQFVSTQNSLVLLGSQFDPDLLSAGGRFQPLNLALPSLTHPHERQLEIAGYRLQH